MAVLRKPLGHCGAQRAQRFDAVAAHAPRMAGAQPRQQRALRGGDDRTHRPQGVVQIETQDQRGVIGLFYAPYAVVDFVSRKLWYLRACSAGEKHDDRPSLCRRFLAARLRYRRFRRAPLRCRRRAPRPGVPAPPRTIATLHRAGPGAPRAHLRNRRIARRQARGLYPAHHRHGGQQGPHRHLAGGYRPSAAAPRARLTDLAANSESAEWSADGRYIYFLSNRSGTSQVWRVAAGEARGVAHAAALSAAPGTRPAPMRCRSPICRSMSAAFASRPRGTGSW